MEYRVPSGWVRPLHEMILGHRCPRAVNSARILPTHCFRRFPHGELTVENLRRLVATVRHSGKLE